MEKQSDIESTKIEENTDQIEMTDDNTQVLTTEKTNDKEFEVNVPDFFSNTKSANLQAKFEAFRNKRLVKNKQKIELKKQSAIHRREKGFKENLRAKFIETAQKYYGTPYSKKYHPADTKYHNAKLYLDCCGLVRRCVWDLREEFGFTLGPFNQNFQFETLPIALEFHELKPGDLIFYEGTYYPHFKHCRQIHNLVHVEIFIGGPTGEQSIGARWSRGVVELHDSFKFESTNYHSVKHYYRSIDTWLDGVCKSHFPKSTFGHQIALDASKNSLFIEETIEEEDLVIPAYHITDDKVAYVSEDCKLAEKNLVDRYGNLTQRMEDTKERRNFYGFLPLEVARQSRSNRLAIA